MYNAFYDYKVNFSVYLFTLQQIDENQQTLVKTKINKLLSTLCLGEVVMASAWLSKHLQSPETRPQLQRKPMVRTVK